MRSQAPHFVYSCDRNSERLNGGIGAYVDLNEFEKSNGLVWLIVETPFLSEGA
jgi:hypothetical protein